MNSIKKFKSDIKSILQNCDTDISGDNFVYIELMLRIIYDTKQKPYDGWILLTQYYKFLLQEEVVENHEKYLYALRKRCHHFANKLNWQRFLQEYFSLAPEIRMFAYEDEKLTRLSLKYLPKRDVNYDDILESILEVKVIKSFFLKSPKAKYKRVVRTHIKASAGTTDNIIKTVMIPEELKALDSKVLPQYREKKKFFIPNDISWMKVYERMGKNWNRRPEFKIINEFSQKGEKLNYKNQIHIVGEVGQGKSNYKIAESYRLVTDFDARIGIVESNVDEVLKTVKALRELGIKAVPVIGKSNLEKYSNNFVKNTSREAECIGDFSMEQFSELEYISGICTLAAIGEDKDISSREFPCSKLLDENDETKLCPLYGSCGYFKRFLELPDAEVWVATPYSLINTTIPKMIDPYERTFYEVFHDLLDIVLVDEADGVQRTFDSLFLNRETLAGKNQSLMDKFEELDKIITDKNLANIESLANTWQMNYYQLKVLIPRITRMMANTEAIHGYLRREVITAFSLFSDIKQGFKVEEYPENETIIKSLEQYFDFTDTYDIKSESIKHEFNELYHEFTWVQNLGVAEEQIRLRIKDLFNTYNVQIPKQKNVDLFYGKFELFVYIVQLDFYIKVLSRDYPILEEKVNNRYEKINVYEGVRLSLRTFLTEPMTGVIFGYKFNPSDARQNQSIDIFRYSGVGRRLLDHMHEIKKEIGINGPAIVLLSGTSVAPDSGHYDLLKKPEYILKSSENNSKIKQDFLIKYDESTNAIKVSGLNGEERATALRKLTKALIRDIRFELKHWNDEKDEKLRNRKVLIIVNSYDNCKEVGKVLRNEGLTYRVLSREPVDEMDYPKELLNTFGDETEEADILVAPMNVICRGYNILNKYSKSYFGSVFFLVRPYMVPDDLESYFQILHSNLDDYLRGCKKKNLSLGESMSEIRRKSYIDLSNIAQNRFWRGLDKDFRKNLAWFTLIPIKQTIGRLQRGGTDCRVFYCDAAFASAVSVGQTIKRENSMLGEWYEILKEHKNDMFIKELYGKYFEGLENMIIEINERQMEEY
jgi:hypothetical protein